MRFSAVALFVGAALAAESTVYSTELLTITSCGPEVTNCPAKTASVVVSSASETTVPVVPTVSSKSWYHNSTIGSAGPTAPLGTAVGTGSVPVAAPTTVLKVSSAPAVCGGVSVKTISTSVTTVVPTVIYETVSVPCATSTPVGTGSASGTGSVPPKSTAVTAGAGNVAFSGALAVAAGALAVFLA